MSFEELLDSDFENTDETEFSGFHEDMPFESFTEEDLENSGVKLLSNEDETEDAPMFTFELKNAEAEARKSQPRINIADILDPSRFVKPVEPSPELFKELYDYNEELTEDDKMQLAFKDYIEIPKISGSLSGLAQSNIIPQTVIEKGEKKVFIEDEKLKEEERAKPSSVILHKNGLDEIETIEVVCSCGRTTAINLIYKEESNTFEFDIDSHSHEEINESDDRIESQIESSEESDDNLDSEV